VNCPACGFDNLPGADHCARCEESLMQEDLPQPRTPVQSSIMLDPIAALHSPAPETVTQQSSVADVVRHMQQANIGYVLVVDNDGKLAGIFTERDLLLKVAGKFTDLASLPISRLMTPNPAALKATEPIKHALFLMAHNSFRHIPLVDDGTRPYGITTVRHLLDYIENVAAAAG
jgi:CBS domain-containing protein